MLPQLKGVANMGISQGDLEMLSGNLASIGVGGIIAVVSSLVVRLMHLLYLFCANQIYDNQWPEDFDFDITRAVNAPEPGSPSADSAAPSLSEKEKSSPEPADAVSVKSEEEDDLDPAKLQKAFRFAAWSSIILVRLSPLCISVMCMLISSMHNSWLYCCC